MRLELKINNETRALPSVQGFVRCTLQQIQFSDSIANKLELLVMHAVRHAIEHAYPSGEVGSIKLTMTELLGRAEITVRDYGLPVDVSRLETELANPSAAAVIAHEAADVVDELHWVALGSQGKSLHFIKWLNTPAVADTSSSAGQPVSDESPLAPEQAYVFRRMVADDALEVSQLIYRTYGGTYFNEDVYYPERIAAANQEDRVLSVVAIGEDGSVAGHCALERNQIGPVAEVGQAVVDPRHRGRGLLNQMKAALESEAKAMGLVGWYADSVAIHTYTQQSNAHHGGHVCGVSLAVSPKNELFRGIAKELSQRVSCILYFHWLHEPEPRRLFVPLRHREMVTAIYESLNCPLEVLSETDLRPTSKVDGTTREDDRRTLAVQVNPRAHLATIRLGQLTNDSLHTIRHAIRELVERSRMEVVVVELPLQNSMTPRLCEALEKEGLGFCGVGPGFSTQGDVLRMSYLVEPLMRDPIKTFEPFADRLVTYALDEQDRVRRDA
ncbi:MAG: GNAT family N-acetyltransferase [Rubripirellula sp.]